MTHAEGRHDHERQLGQAGGASKEGLDLVPCFATDGYDIGREYADAQYAEEDQQCGGGHHVCSEVEYVVGRAGEDL